MSALSSAVVMPLAMSAITALDDSPLDRRQSSYHGPNDAPRASEVLLS